MVTDVAAPGEPGLPEPDRLGQSVCHVAGRTAGSVAWLVAGRLAAPTERRGAGRPRPRHLQPDLGATEKGPAGAHAATIPRHICPGPPPQRGATAEDGRAP